MSFYAITSFTYGESVTRSYWRKGQLAIYFGPSFLLFIQASTMEHLLCVEHCARYSVKEMISGFWHQERHSLVGKKPGKQEVIIWWLFKRWGLPGRVGTQRDAYHVTGLIWYSDSSDDLGMGIPAVGVPKCKRGPWQYDLEQSQAGRPQQGRWPNPRTQRLW